MQRCTRSILPGLLLTVLATLCIGTGSVAAMTSNGAKWHLVASPNPMSSDSTLRAVATLAANNVWAVGSSYSSINGTPSVTLIEHWNGSQWSIVPSPNHGTHGNFLYGITATSSSDIWAVGSYYPAQGGGKTLIEHWNGTSWSIVASPNPGNAYNELYGVTAISASDIWAVGNYTTINPFLDQTLIEHWNGSSWQVVKSANPGVADNTLQSVAAVSAGDIWAVGAFAVGNGHDQTLTEHWNGTSWTVVASPNVGSFPNFLLGVSVVSSNDVWAAGYSAIYPGDLDDTLVEHWNGSAWSVVPSPNPQNDSNYLLAIAVVSSQDIWAVGYAYGYSTNAVTLVEHWNGSAWSVVPSPNRQPPSDSLGAIAVLSATDIWAVGFHITPSLEFQTLTEHYY